MYDYGFRIYNPRLGRFLSVDPLTQSYPWYTPYQFAGNRPINAGDLDGMEEIELTLVAKHLYNPKLQNQAKAIASSDKQALVAMQRTAWNQVIVDLDAIVAKHFDPKKNVSISADQWNGITSGVREYLQNGSSLVTWNSYANYDYNYASWDEVETLLNGTVDALIQNHFWASTSGTGYYYRYIAAINGAKDPNKQAALIAEREVVSKQRWSTVFAGMSLGFAEMFLAASGLSGGGSANIGGRTFKTGYYASEDAYFLLKLGDGAHGGYSPIYRAAPKEGELFALKTNEYVVKKSGPYPARGLSLNINASEAGKFGTDVFRIKSIPDELRLIRSPSKNMPGHVDIIPKDLKMTQERFQELLNQIQYEKVIPN